MSNEKLESQAEFPTPKKGWIVRQRVGPHVMIWEAGSERQLAENPSDGDFCPDSVYAYTKDQLIKWAESFGLDLEGPVKARRKGKGGYDNLYYRMQKKG